jgi:predicted peroxiredoxin
MAVNPKDARILIVATSGPENPKQCPAPFLFAQEAAGMGADVSICFVAQGPMLLKQGVADSVYPKEGERPLSELIHETLKAGVRFQVCGAALELNAMTPEDLIEEVEELVGPSFLITRGLEADLVLNF